MKRDIIIIFEILVHHLDVLVQPSCY